MCEQIYHTQYGLLNITKMIMLYCLPGKKCSYDDYRNTTLSALTALQKYKNSSVVIDAKNDFEDEPADVEWGFHILLPAMAKTTCRFVIFIMEAVNDIEEEMDMWTMEISKYFTVEKVTAYAQAVNILKVK